MSKYCVLRSLLAGFLLFLAHTVYAEIPTYIPPSQRPLPIDQTPWPKGHYLVINYHNVTDGAADQRFVSVRTSALIDQWTWLREHGFHNITIDDILRAQRHEKPLPPKAFLLTFDDGYRSFYTRVFPLLKAYGWHAVLAPVGRWLDTPLNKKVNFSGVPLNRKEILTWPEVKEMSQSGIVEIGAHTYDSHDGIVANPQGNLEPAATSRQYFSKLGRYETKAEFEHRMTQDVARETQRIKEVTGKHPRVWVWPYGAANGETLSIVKRFGYQFAFTLGNGLASVDSPYNATRLLIGNNPKLNDFAQMINTIEQRQLKRVIHVDLDYVYDPNPAQEQRNINVLIQRLADMRVSTVFLQAFADPKGDGVVRSVYFPNHWLPMRSDLFNRIAWQLMTRARVQVYAWMPVLAFDFNKSGPRVMQLDPRTGKVDIDPRQYQRLSLWNSENRRKIIGLYEDLATYTHFDGLLFSDDALLSDYEDASPDAMKAYVKAGFPSSIQAIRANPELFEKWTHFKTQALTHFTQLLTQHVRQIEGDQVNTARNIYALPILNPQSEAWFGQNLSDFLANYNWVVPMAMPYMEGVDKRQSDQWIAQLVKTVAKYPHGLDKTIFELQARDWNTGKAIPTKRIIKWMKTLELNGAENFGYYPDDAIRNQPNLRKVRTLLSSAWYPLP